MCIQRRFYMTFKYTSICTSTQIKYVNISNSYFFAMIKLISIEIYWAHQRGKTKILKIERLPLCPTGSTALKICKRMDSYTLCNIKNYVSDLNFLLSFSVLHLV